LRYRERAEQVKARAAALGFDACGVAAAGLVDPDDRLGAWLARGFHAGMKWMATSQDVRQDVRKKLPGARAVVVVARNYYAPRPGRQANSGRVSRYAWGRDYHRVIGRPLRALASYIRALEPGAEAYVSVDTGPVLERAWAARAGVGWVGKNGLAVRRDLGSWFFLGVVVTTVQLEPDSPAVDQCQDCRLCIDACPTGAIVEPRVIDANRCISYHTVENRDERPEALRAKFGDWVFGCDVCQEVCPWNQSVQVTTEHDFHPRPGCANPDLAGLAELNDAQFNSMFKGSVVRRAGIWGIRRNAGIAKENVCRTRDGRVHARTRRKKS